MPYLDNTAEDQRAMLEAIGAASIEELFSSIPDELQLGRDLNIPPALTEIELTQHMSALARKNDHSGRRVCFLGGGCYDHFVPAVIDTIAGRGEFYTAYTPYQAEVSQGTLQAMFEFQTLIARLTGMDVSNTSVYDGGSATAEAALMSIGATKRHGKIVTTAGVHPEYRQTITTYLEQLDTTLVTVGSPDGVVNLDDLAATVDDQTACVLIQQPNFFGCLEDVDAIAKIAHDAGALLVVSVDPISLGLLRRPGDYGADIVVAEGQSLGTPMSYGGPFLGIMAANKEHVRRMPGRIVGQTVDRRDKRCYVLTLQTREQHIRRERATSNICTNQGLLALRATTYLSLVGPQGLREVANLCLQKARYAAEQIIQNERFSLAFAEPTFKEFVIRDAQGRVDELLAAAAQSGYFAGVPLGQWYPELADCFLVAVTEQRTKDEIDGLARSLCCARTPETSAC